MSSTTNKATEIQTQGIGLVESFDEFVAQFPYQGETLYQTVYRRHNADIRVKKETLACQHLEKIFDATFSISSHIGFHEMSLRDLCHETGISMGGMYSCINKKENIAVWIMDIVDVISSYVIETGRQQNDEWLQLCVTLQQHLFASHCLQPWFFFLYFETRCLPLEKQQQSMAIELTVIENLADIIRNGVAKGIFATDKPDAVANTILVMMQDFYLKPWKNKQYHMAVEHYADDLFAMVGKLINHETASESNV